MNTIDPQTPALPDGALHLQQVLDEQGWPSLLVHRGTKTHRPTSSCAVDFWRFLREIDVWGGDQLILNLGDQLVLSLDVISCIGFQQRATETNLEPQL